MGEIGGRLGPTLKPGRLAREYGVQGSSGTRGAGRPVANKVGDGDDTGEATAGEVSILFAANDARVVTKGTEASR